MARPLRITYPGAFYHVTPRGNERKVIFKSKRDRGKFLDYFESATQRYDAAILVFCLLCNRESFTKFKIEKNSNRSRVMVKNRNNPFHICKKSI